MEEIKGKEPIYRSSKKYWSADKLKQTLGYYYRKKRRECAEDLPGFFNPDLRKIFREIPGTTKKEPAHKFIQKHRKNIISAVGIWTGKNKYVITKIVKNLIETSKELDLYRYSDAEITLLELTSYINTLVMNYLFTGRLKQCP